MHHLAHFLHIELKVVSLWRILHLIAKKTIFCQIFQIVFHQFIISVRKEREREFIGREEAKDTAQR